MKKEESRACVQYSRLDAFYKISHQRAEWAWESPWLPRAEESKSSSVPTRTSACSVCWADTNIFWERDVFQLLFRMAFPDGLISVEVFFPLAQWKRNLLPNSWDQTFDFCHKEMLFNEVRKEYPPPNTYQNLKHPNGKSSDPPNEIG